MITTKLKKCGSDLLLELPASLLEPLGMDEGTAVEIFASDGSLLVRPLEDSDRRRKFEQALESVIERHGDMLRRLADS